MTGGMGLLAGMRILEACEIAAGPFAGSLLADLGADVVKIERPDKGDHLRDWPPISVSEEGEAFSENFASINRNKRSMVLNIKSAMDVEQLHELVSVADVFIENYRPGVLARHKLSYEDLKQINPRLVYCSITGFGSKGPYASKGAFDVTVQGMSGLMSVTGNEGGPPAKCGVPVGDFCAGLYGAYCILACVMRSRETGLGSHIDCSMFGSMIGVAALQTSEYFGTGQPAVALGSAHPRNAPYQAFEAADKHFIIAAGTDRMWLEVCQAVDLPDLVQDPRFSTQRSRAANQYQLYEYLAPRFRERNAGHWLRELDQRGVPCGPINSYADVAEDPHVQAMHLIRPLSLPNGVETRTTAFPIAISDFEFELRRPPPKLGAHNGEVVAEWLGPKQGIAHKESA